MPSPYYPFMSLTGRGHDTSQILDFFLIGLETIPLKNSILIGWRSSVPSSGQDYQQYSDRGGVFLVFGTSFEGFLSRVS